MMFSKDKYDIIIPSAQTNHEKGNILDSTAEDKHAGSKEG